jgi:hypothetical protein
LVAFFILISCEKNNIPIYGYVLGGAEVEHFVLNKTKESEKINFKYLSKINEMNSLNVAYYINNDVLLFGSDTLESINKNYNSKNFDYKSYQSKETSTDKSTFIFNKDYGVLAILGAKKQTLYLKDSISYNESKTIFKEIFYSLNKINIE